MKLALGNILNVIPAASGVHIPLTHADAVTFVTYEDDGTTILTFKQSIDGASEANLAVITTAHKAPGVGGTWTAVTQAAATTFNLASDTTNDCAVVTVHANQLSDGYNCVECTTDGGICIAIIHDLTMKRKPSRLPTNKA